MEPNEKRVVSHPKNTAFAEGYASVLGLNVQVTKNCPPDSVYVLDPSQLFSKDNERWPYTMGRIDNVG